MNTLNNLIKEVDRLTPPYFVDAFYVSMAIYEYCLELPEALNKTYGYSGVKIKLDAALSAHEVEADVRFKGSPDEVKRCKFVNFGAVSVPVPIEDKFQKSVEAYLKVRAKEIFDNFSGKYF